MARERLPFCLRKLLWLVFAPPETKVMDRLDDLALVDYYDGHTTSLREIAARRRAFEGRL